MDCMPGSEEKGITELKGIRRRKKLQISFTHTHTHTHEFTPSDHAEIVL